MDNMMNSATRWMFILIASAFIMWLFLPQWKSVTLGIALGLIASSMNAFLLHRRVGLIANYVEKSGKPSRPKGLGFGNRIATVLLLVMIAYRYPDIINIPAALAGSLVMPFLILAAAIVHTVKENNSGKE